MKSIPLIVFLLLFSGIESFSQDSVYVIQKGQFLKYRPGYLVTTRGDTLKGLIWHENDDRICFIREGIQIKTPVLGSFSTIPSYTAEDGRLKGFYRNGLTYELSSIPPDNSPVFLTILESGPLTLYALLTNYADKQLSDQMVNPTLLSSLANEGDKTKDEYYDVKNYFLRKGTAGSLIRVPNSEKRFLNTFLPLIRDNAVFVKELPMLPLDYYHLRNLVKEYNATSGKILKTDH
jgi:hypothetical protein